MRADPGSNESRWDCTYLKFCGFSFNYNNCHKADSLSRTVASKINAKKYYTACVFFGSHWNCRFYRLLNLKVDRNREYFTSDAIYNGSAGMTLYYYMCRSWQDCCRRGENRSWPSVSVESVDSECWCLNYAIFYNFIMRLTVEERVFILGIYLKTMSYAHCRQSLFEKFRRQAPVKSATAKIIKKFRETGSLLDKNRNRQKSVLTPGISALKWTSFPTLTVNTG